MKAADGNYVPKNLGTIRFFVAKYYDGIDLCFEMFVPFSHYAFAFSQTKNAII